MTPSTAVIICARAPRRVLPVPVVRELTETVARKGGAPTPLRERAAVTGSGLSPVSVSSWRCSWCGARVKVVA